MSGPSFTIDWTDESTDGSGLIEKRLIVERFGDKVSMLMSQKGPSTNHVTLVHMPPLDAEAIATAIRATAARAQKQGES